MPSVQRCIDVYLSHHVSEITSLSEPMLFQWLRGQTYYDLRIHSTNDVRSDDCKAEAKSCAKHGLEPKGNGEVNLISQKEKQTT